MVLFLQPVVASTSAKRNRRSRGTTGRAEWTTCMNTSLQVLQRQRTNMASLERRQTLMESVQEAGSCCRLAVVRQRPYRAQWTHHRLRLGKAQQGKRQCNSSRSTRPHSGERRCCWLFFFTCRGVVSMLLEQWGQCLTRSTQLFTQPR